MTIDHAESGAAIISDVFVWDRHFDTGIFEIDNQHKEMVQLVNLLGRMQVCEAEAESFSRALLKVLDDFADCVEHHFGFEEAFMGRYYLDPEHSATHRHGHADFSKRISEAKSAAISYPASVAGRMLTFLSRWLVTHIVGTDMHMAKKILAMQSGMNEEEASHAASAAMGNTSTLLLESLDRLYECLSRRTHDLVEVKHRLDREIVMRRQAEAELRMLWRAVEHSPVSVIITNADGEFEYVNPKFSELTGYTPREVEGKTPRILKSGETPPAKYEQIWQAISSGREWHGQLSNRKKNGELYWENLAISPVMGHDGNVTHYVAIQENITEQKQAEEALYEQKQFSDDVINGLPGIFYMLSSEGRFMRVNREFLAVSGYSREEFVHMSALDFFEGQDKELVAQKVKEVFRRGNSRCQAEFVVRSGRRIPYDFTGHRTYIGGKPYLVGLGLDVTERRELENELAKQARTDFLTGLCNRRYFMTKAEQEFARAIRYGKQLSVLMFDLDKFKLINDKYGHATGDLVLRMVADICRETLREMDIVGRLGGEEFAIVLPETDMLQATETAERLRIRISETTLQLDNARTINVTASIGISTYGASDTDMHKLLHRADKAMYDAKHAGRDSVMIAYVS